MESQFLEYFMTNWPLPTLIMITVTGLVILAYRVGVLWTIQKMTNKKVSELPCDQNKIFLNTKMAALSEDIVAIRTFLIGKHKEAGVVFFMEKRSPYQLTENGKRIYNTVIHGDKFLKDNRELLFEKLDQLNPKKALDVENGCIEVLFSLTENEMFDKLKDIIYLSPPFEITTDGETREYNLTLMDVCYMLAIPFRDLYLKEHPGILPSTDLPIY